MRQAAADIQRLNLFQWWRDRRTTAVGDQRQGLIFVLSLIPDRRQRVAHGRVSDHRHQRQADWLAVAQLSVIAPAIQVRATFGAEQLAGLVRGRPTSPATLPRLAINRFDLLALLCDDLVALGEEWRGLLHCR